jgi:hypothetical protein
MPIQVRGVLVHAMSGTELSRVRTELQLRLPEPINKSPLESRGADIVMQSNGFPNTRPTCVCYTQVRKGPKNRNCHQIVTKTGVKRAKTARIKKTENQAI